MALIVYVSCLPPSDRTTYGVMTEWAKREPSPEVSTSSSNRFPPLNLSRSFDAPPAENHRIRSSRHSQYMGYGSESARDLDLGGVTSHGHRPSRSREILSLNRSARSHRTSGSHGTPRSKPRMRHHSLDTMDDSYGKQHPLGEPNMFPMYGTPR
ncbi:hypothetical protein LSAT2_005698 [Lamellibrachia satsuma]|nr:hypothetical protein LSAT2_005698 [Lamellibrachia satsuma]